MRPLTCLASPFSLSPVTRVCSTARDACFCFGRGSSGHQCSPASPSLSSPAAAPPAAATRWAGRASGTPAGNPLLLAPSWPALLPPPARTCVGAARQECVGSSNTRVGCRKTGVTSKGARRHASAGMTSVVGTVDAVSRGTQASPVPRAARNVSRVGAQCAEPAHVARKGQVLGCCCAQESCTKAYGAPLCGGEHTVPLCVLLRPAQKHTVPLCVVVMPKKLPGLMLVQCCA